MMAQSFAPLERRGGVCKVHGPRLFWPRMEISRQAMESIEQKKENHPRQKQTQWLDVTPLSSGGGHLPGFVRIGNRIPPTNSSAGEKDSRSGSWNKAVLPLWVALRFLELRQTPGQALVIV
jgi:hypothetical protein